MTLASRKSGQIRSARRGANAKDGTMEAQEQGAVDEELTARMFSKLTYTASRRLIRRVRPDERDDFIEFQKIHRRQNNAGGGRDSGH
jgi:hypothetical protein